MGAESLVILLLVILGTGVLIYLVRLFTWAVVTYRQWRASGPCPHCDERISRLATVCPYCRARMAAEWSVRRAR